MGSQTLDIFRQGVWASLTGGWFYDPHQNVFCNAVHLYIWLFFLCTPFFAYLYFPKTFATWGAYGIATACMMAVLKIINMALHMLYDRSQALSETGSKKAIRDSECGGIEMQVLGLENALRSSLKGQPCECSAADSVASFDIEGNNASTIDFKVDVHRKNSSGSNESALDQIAQGAASISEQNAHNQKSDSRDEKSGQSEDDKCEDNRICSANESDGAMAGGNSEITSDAIRRFKSRDGTKPKLKTKLNRQSSLDIAEIPNAYSLHSHIGHDDPHTLNFHLAKLHRHNSSDSAEDNPNRSISSNSFHEQHVKMPKTSLHLYLEGIYAKSDLGIENLEQDIHKFSLEPCKHMRKDSNGTMSALQLPMEGSNSNARKRRHSNTGSKVIHMQPTGVRRIKSAALEISCLQPSVSNLSAHPNSAETISGRQIKNPQSAILPPPSKCLVRNAHLNLCPKMDSHSGIINAAIDPVYPIAEQVDEKNMLTDDYSEHGALDKKIQNLNNLNRKRCSITESESDLDRPRTRSTDSDADINGSSSPLLNRLTHSDNLEIRDRKAISSSMNLGRIHYNNDCAIRSRNKGGDSGCPSSDCEQASASSKDMLLASSSKCNSKASNFASTAKNCSRDEKPLKNEAVPSTSQKDSKSLGAIPKTSRRSEEIYTQCDELQSVIQKSPSTTSSDDSLKSYIFEKFPTEIYSNYRDQWLIIGDTKHNMLPITYVASDAALNTHPRRALMDGNFKLTPTLHRSNATKRRKRSEGYLKDEGESARPLETENDDAQVPKSSVALSLTDFVQAQYQEQLSITRPSRGTVLNIRGAEFNESAYSDYWRSLSTEKQIPPKRCYKYRLKWFGSKELKIKMDRLQLLALFDRDLNWFHVILSVLLSVTVCFLGSVILNLGIYKDVSAFLFCLVIAGSQYSLLKSVQPDAASPVHGFNKTVAYSRPIYFCLFCSLLLLSRYISNELRNDELWKHPHAVSMFGISFIPVTLFDSLTYWISIVLLLFPVLFSLGLFPQFNTFCMYVLEQIDMHIFGGSAVCSLLAAILCVLKSIIAVCILYGPIYGGLAEKKGTQHISFSIFCAMLVSLSYHYSRCATDFSHIWSLIKSSFFNYADDDEEDIDKSNTKIYNLDEKADGEGKKEKAENNDNNDKSTPGDSTQSIDTEQPDPLPKKLQNTVNCRLKNDLVVCSAVGIFILALHSTTVFTVLQPDLNGVLFSIAGVLGFCLHYVIPQMRKHLPWLCFARPILKQREFGRFEVSEASKIMSFEQLYVYLCFLEKNVLYPLIFISALTADSQKIVNKFGLPLGTTLVAVSALKAVRSSYADTANQYLVIAFCVLLFKFDFSFASETFLLNYFVVSTIYRKLCEFLLKMQFVVTYIAPWQITWGSAFHAFAQPFSVPHSAMLFVQAAISATLSTPLNPFLGSAIFLTSYARPIKFWERDYNTRRIDHSNTRLSSQLERDLGADDNNLNSIFYEHLTRSLQHSLCGDLMLGRWGNVNQGDCFVLASDYLNCLVHIIELGNGLCTFQMRGLEFRGTYCQQREVEAISEEIADNDGCCCCSPGHMPSMLSANAMFSTRWLAWQVVAAQYVLEGYSISENLATATLQLFEFRKVLITYYIKSIIYYVTQSHKLNEWLAPGPIQEALENTLNRQFVDLDPIFNYNLDEDFDFRALGITRGSFCFVYLNWIQFCYSKRIAERNALNTSENECSAEKNSQSKPMQSSQNSTDKVNENEAKKDGCMENDCSNAESVNNEHVISKDSQLVSLCLALGLLARRSLATASHGSLSGVEFFLHGLHALFKGDFRITSPRDEWVFADMELLHGVVAPAVKMGLKLHQDHFSSPDEYLDPAVLYDAIKSHTKELVISHEADPVWRNAVLRGAPNLLALRHVMEDGSDEYRIIRLTKRFLSFRVIKLNRECVRGLWAGQQQELIYLRNRNPERGSIQNAKQALRNIINSSCDQPIGYPIYVSSLTTSYAETNEQLRELIGGSITPDSIQNQLLNYWKRIKRRCQEGCSSGSGVIDCDNTNELSGNYFLPSSAGNATTLTCGSQSLPSSSIRGSLASMNKPSNSALLVGFLNREREQDRDYVRERLCKKTLSLRGTDRTDRDKASASTSISPNNPESSLKDTSETFRKQSSNPEAFTLTISSNSSEHLSEHDTKTSFDFPQDNILLTEIPKGADQMLVEINKKVIIVDGMEIYDCLDLGRRIDVIWPNEKMRLNGGRSSWKDWSPKEGMVGFVVHYWQPNHPDQRFRSNVNRTLYLVAIGDRFVPVGERGIKEYKQIGLDFAQVKPVLASNDSETETDSFFNIPKAASIYDLEEVDVVVDSATAADLDETRKE